MRLYILISTCVCFGLVYTAKCPDGTACEETDICCQRYLLGRTFICCTQNLACTKTFGIGHCRILRGLLLQELEALLEEISQQSLEEIVLKKKKIFAKKEDIFFG
ncbi:uncharacterized protein TNIN_329021 [Trichonephila inaurata madagascariensis]|uniref:Uncharacterized protein n=1 Tax=Trichonephila inaurata madagascariensis TaxID=2747483 RepID=A0A8X6XY37_9ARAC|nr:uncharacterized protein TNIN_329021 [Trichonephila inaurata madagascariensis]